MNLPPRRVRLGAVFVDTWRAMASTGVVVGAAWFVGVSAATGGSPWVAVGLPPVLVVGFVAASLARRRVAHRETTVLLEQLFVALAVTALLTAAVGLDPVRWLDRLLPALAVLFAFGRVGCTAAGCCHGVESSIGLGPIETRRFPTQPLEAAAWLWLAGMGTAVAVAGERGMAASAVLVAYGLIRFALEGVRGDRRPHWLGWSESRWLSVAAGGLGLWLAPAPGADAIVIAGAGAVAAAVLWGTRSRWLQASRRAPASDEVEAWARITWPSLTPGGGVRSARLGDVTLAASRQPGSLVVTVASADERRLGLDEAEPVLRAVASSLGGSVPEILEPRAGLFLVTFPDEARAAPGPARPANYFG